MIFKTSIKYLFMIAAVAIGFQSCSSDDDENNSASAPSQVVAGTYSGYSSASFQYSATPMCTNGETVTITSNTDGTVNVNFNSGTWGTTTISKASVALNGTEYSIKGTGSTAAMSHSGSASAYECTLEGTISSDKKTYSLAFTMNFMGGTTVTFMNGEATAAQLLAGSYKGYSSASFQYTSTPMCANGEKVAMTSNEDGTVNVTFTSGTWGTTTIENATVTLSGTDYSIVGSGSTAITGHSGTASTYACTLSGTISSDKSTYRLDFVMEFMGKTVVSFINGEATAAQLLQGTYKGWSHFAFPYLENGMDCDAQAMTMTANEDGTLTISYTSEELGSCEIPVTVEADGDNYKLAGEGSFSMGMNGSDPKEYACTVEGTISSDKATYSIVFTLPSVMNGSTITFQNGSAPTTAE